MIPENSESSSGTAALHPESTLPTADRPLEALAADINQAHAEAQAYASKAVERALVAGDLLIQAKARVAHGQWLPWLKTHCHAISTRTIQDYMRVARELPPEKRSAAHLPSVREALRLVAGEPDREPITGSLFEALPSPTPVVKSVIPLWERKAPADVAAMLRQWPDMRLTACAYLDSDGIDVPPMARLLGISEQEVLGAIDPQLPPIMGIEKDDYSLTEDMQRVARHLIATWQGNACLNAAYWARQANRPDLIAPLESQARGLDRKARRLAQLPRDPLFYIIGVDLARAAMEIDCAPGNIHMESALLSMVARLPDYIWGDSYRTERAALAISYKELGKATYQDINAQWRILKQFDVDWTRKAYRALEIQDEEAAQ